MCCYIFFSKTIWLDGKFVKIRNLWFEIRKSAVSFEKIEKRGHRGRVISKMRPDEVFTTWFHEFLVLVNSFTNQRIIIECLLLSFSQNNLIGWKIGENSEFVKVWGEQFDVLRVWHYRLWSFKTKINNQGWIGFSQFCPSTKYMAFIRKSILIPRISRQLISK